MKNHQIELNGLQEWLNENEALYALSTQEKKKLTVTMRGGFRLYHNNELVWEGIQPFQAVEKYNDI